MHNILSALEHSLEAYSAFPQLRNLLTHERFSPNVNLLAIGKSAYAMAQAACAVLTSQGKEYDGYLLTKYDYAPNPIPNLISCEAGHPLPDANSIKHSRDILGWLSSLPAEEDIIILLSGGGSALFEVPEGRKSIDDLIYLNKHLLNSGLSIAEMNAERSKLSKVKGGKALNYIACKRIFCYALSDVENNDPSVIASAPFYADNAPQLTYQIVGDNLSYLETLAQFIGREAIVHQGFISQSAEHWAKTLASLTFPPVQPGIHIFGGETPVLVEGAGNGGRCTHIALDFTIRIAGNDHASLITYATDGSDNLPGVGGAIVNGNTVNQLYNKGIDAAYALQNSDSYTALKQIGAIIPAFPDHINVNDIFILSL